MVSHLDAEKREQWDAELVDLLPWQDVRSEAAIQIESDSFFNMMSKSQ